MKSLHLTLGLALMIPVSQAPNIDQLKRDIEKEFASVQGTFALALTDLAGGATLLINERESFHAASTMKTPVMIEVFKQAKAGRFSLQDSLVVKNEFRSIVDSSAYSLDLGEDNDDSMYKKIGTGVSIRELVNHMITVSSNLATNILIDLVGPKNVTASMRALGAHEIQVLRGVEDIKAFDLGMNNTTNAHDLMLIFEAIGRRRVVDDKNCEEMVRILLGQKFREKIPALLPEGTKVAHKTGNITGVEHDSGIVFLPDGRQLVIVLLSKNVKDAPAAKKAMSRVSKKIYDYFLTVK
ncbi:MAG: serine hydrolase [Ignavibacteriales bacterium]|nr:serine hydrolase [Ignavibacteriales bacterium]